MGALVEHGATRRRAREDRRARPRSAHRLRRSGARRRTAKARSCRRCCCAATQPGKAERVHDVEAFGPVATLMPYRDSRDAIALVNRGKGSLVMSLFTYDPSVAREVRDWARARSTDASLILDRDCAKESTGHGSPLPILVHGGPGRAGGGEEMGGMRGVMHYMQRTALAGQPAHAGRGDAQLDARRAGDRATGRIPSACASASSSSARRSSPSRARSRSTTSSISRISPATPSMPTWTRKPRRPIRSSADAWRTAI